MRFNNHIFQSHLSARYCALCSLSTSPPWYRNKFFSQPLDEWHQFTISISLKSSILVQISLSFPLNSLFSFLSQCFTLVPFFFLVSLNSCFLWLQPTIHPRLHATCPCWVPTMMSKLLRVASNPMCASTLIFEVDGEAMQNGFASLCGSAGNLSVNFQHYMHNQPFNHDDCINYICI